MIIPLPNTTTGEIAKKLVDAQEHYTRTTGRVLTLIVEAQEGDDLEQILASVRDASHEHPSRVLVVVPGDPNSDTQLDAQLRVGGEAGASETVVMQLHGALADQAESVLTPLLLPDTPLVAWWPNVCPQVPSESPVGKLAQRRITNVAHKGTVSEQDLRALSHGYSPGDSDMSWASITLWRGVVASALDHHPHEKVLSVEVAGPAGHPAPNFAAGWLLDRLSVPVQRMAEETNSDYFPVTHLRFNRETTNVDVDVVDERTVRVRVPGTPDSLVSLSPRTQTEILSEELRHLDADKTYAQALRALGEVDYSKL